MAAAAAASSLRKARPPAQSWPPFAPPQTWHLRPQPPPGRLVVSWGLAPCTHLPAPARNTMCSWQSSFASCKIGCAKTAARWTKRAGGTKAQQTGSGLPCWDGGAVHVLRLLPFHIQMSILWCRTRHKPQCRRQCSRGRWAACCGSLLPSAPTANDCTFYQ